jgi:glycosyltransferase involved in cell wall biosynthesis
VIHNGIDIDFFSRAKDERRDRVFSIVHIANVRPEKDQWMLIRSLCILNQELSDWSLTFIGKDRDGLLAKFKEYLQRRGLADKVTFFETAERKHIRDALFSADVFVLTSVMEVFPVSMLEAMAMGLPCVVTDVGGCPEIVTDSYDGYLVKPKDHQAIADKLLFLFKNPQFVKQMGENARKTVLEKFSLELCAKKYIEMFNEVISNDR